MSQHLYTREQWAAAFEIERFTDMEPGYFWHIHDLKRAIGGVFDCASFWTGKVILVSGRIDFHVIERDSGLIMGHAHETRGEALTEARELILATGSDLLLSIVRERSATRPPPKEIPKEVPRSLRPRKVSKRAKAVFDASGGKCYYCGCDIHLTGRWHIEHKFPRALFGGSEQENLVASCAPCNHAKRDKTDLEFKALLASKSA